MSNYENKAPGVYIEEITPVGPIVGAGTSTAAFIGRANKDLSADSNVGPPVRITNWSQYRALFGDDVNPDKTLSLSVRGFFENGGTVLYILPVKDASDIKTVGNALDELTRLPDVSIVCAPGVVKSDVQKTLVDHCETMKYRFAILDGVQSTDLSKADGPLQTQAASLKSANGFNALYWPWIVISDVFAPSDKPSRLAQPPSGHVAGIFARSDDQRGVHKAPANEVIRGALDLTFRLNDTDQGLLNQANINALRLFAGQPPMVWGARTLTDSTAWRYVNVRRLFSYVEDSLQSGLRWAVFEPNNTALWKKLERSVTEFLTRVWVSGALFGRTTKEAFYVKIDEELNTPAIRALGQVIIEIGMAPVRPAEFVIIRIGIWDGGSQISEG